MNIVKRFITLLHIKPEPKNEQQHSAHRRGEGGDMLMPEFRHGTPPPKSLSSRTVRKSGLNYVEEAIIKRG